VNTAPICDLVTDYRVFDLFIEPFLEFGEEDFALLRIQTMGSKLNNKVIWRKHAIIEDGQHDGINNHRAKLLHNIQGQCRATIEGTVKVADEVVEAYQLYSARNLARE